jgi:hypothetical protein
MKGSLMNLKNRTLIVPIILSLSKGLLMPGALSAMNQPQNNNASQEPPRTIFNLNIETSLVNKNKQLLSKRALNCTAYGNKTVTEHSNNLVPCISDVSSLSDAEAATQYSTKIEMLPVFTCSDLKTALVEIRCQITKTLNGKTIILQPNQLIRFSVVGIRKTECTEPIECDTEELTLNITAHRTISKLEAQGLAHGLPIDFFD